MIQIAAQIRILVAVEAIDGRKGIDAIAQLCREKLKAIHFLATYLSSALGGVRPFEFCNTMARGSGWRRNAYPRGVSNGGRQAPKRCERCERIRRNCCWRQAILTRTLHRHGGP